MRPVPRPQGSKLSVGPATFRSSTCQTPTRSSGTIWREARPSKAPESWATEWVTPSTSTAPRPGQKPPAKLKWYINNEKVLQLIVIFGPSSRLSGFQVDSSYVRESPPVPETGGLYTANLRLHFKLKRFHFVQGHVSVKCTAQIYTEYFQSSKLDLPGIGLGEKALGISGRTNGNLSQLKNRMKCFQSICSLSRLQGPKILADATIIFSIPTKYIYDKN